VRISLSPKQLREYCQCADTLKAIFQDTTSVWPTDRLYVTSIARTKEEDRSVGGSGIHATGPPHRAIDIRIVSFGDDYMEKAELIAEIVNGKWEYDPNRSNLNVCVVSVMGTGHNIHLQVHPRTRRRNG